MLFPLDLVAHPDDLAAELSEFGKHIRTMWEITGGDGEIRLRRLDNASADFFWSVAISVGSGVASILWGIAKFREKIANARKLEAEARKLNAEAADILRKHTADDLEKARTEVHDSLLAQSNIRDKGRQNELSGFTKHAIAYFESRIDRGVIFEVRAPDLPTTASEGGGEEREKVVAQIRERGAALTPMDTQLRLPLLAGDTEER